LHLFSANKLNCRQGGELYLVFHAAVENLTTFLAGKEVGTLGTDITNGSRSICPQARIQTVSHPWGQWFTSHIRVWFLGVSAGGEIWTACDYLWGEGG
jgi:hypothetical protein